MPSAPALRPAVPDRLWQCDRGDDSAAPAHRQPVRAGL